MADSVERVGGSRKHVKRAAGSRTGKSTEGTDATESSASNGETRFFDVLAGVTGSAAENQLGEILGEIRELAVVLGKKRLLEDLESYREKVGEFLKVYMDEILGVREAAGKRNFSRRKQLLVVKKVNVEIEELSRMILGDAPELTILKELGTIEGLLMDIYR